MLVFSAEYTVQAYVLHRSLTVEMFFGNGVEREVFFVGILIDTVPTTLKLYLLIYLKFS